MDLTNQRLGNYVLIGHIGSGGYADVYRGNHLYMSQSKQVAIKVLKGREFSQAEEQTFLTEAGMLEQLNHPHIIHVLDCGVESLQFRIPYLVMDYAPLGTMRGAYPEGARVPLPAIVRYTSQMADALYYAHEVEGPHKIKIVHCDVKPENMLRDAKGDLLLSDFGIAKEHLKTIEIPISPQTGKMTRKLFGTPAYISPELWTDGLISRAGDQYALGIVVYEWLAGFRPFQGNFPEIMIKHVKDNPPSIRAKYPDVPQEVEDVVMKALSKEIRDRYPTIKDFAEELEKASAYSGAQRGSKTLSGKPGSGNQVGQALPPVPGNQVGQTLPPVPGNQVGQTLPPVPVQSPRAENTSGQARQVLPPAPVQLSGTGNTGSQRGQVLPPAPVKLPPPAPVQLSGAGNMGSQVGQTLPPTPAKLPPPAPVQLSGAGNIGNQRGQVLPPAPVKLPPPAPVQLSGAGNMGGQVGQTLPPTPAKLPPPAPVQLSGTGNTGGQVGQVLPPAPVKLPPPAPIQLSGTVSITGQSLPPNPTNIAANSNQGNLQSQIVLPGPGAGSPQGTTASMSPTNTLAGTNQVTLPGSSVNTGNVGNQQGQWRVRVAGNAANYQGYGQGGNQVKVGNAGSQQGQAQRMNQPNQRTAAGATTNLGHQRVRVAELGSAGFFDGQAPGPYVYVPRTLFATIHLWLIPVVTLLAGVLQWPDVIHCALFLVAGCLLELYFLWARYRVHPIGAFVCLLPISIGYLLAIQVIGSQSAIKFRLSSVVRSIQAFSALSSSGLHQILWIFAILAGLVSIYFNYRYTARNRA